MKLFIALAVGLLIGFALATMAGPVLAEMGTCYEYFGTTSCTSIGGPGRTFIDTGVGMTTYQDTDGGGGQIFDYGRGTKTYTFTPGRKDPC
jgi:hypothetical protein